MDRDFMTVRWIENRSSCVHGTKTQCPDGLSLHGTRTHFVVKDTRIVLVLRAAPRSLSLGLGRTLTKTASKNTLARIVPIKRIYHHKTLTPDSRANHFTIPLFLKADSRVQRIVRWEGVERFASKDWSPAPCLTVFTLVRGY